jgi:hypothetical protein
MALVLADRVRETTTTAGTGTITLLGAVPSCQSFAAVGDGNTTYYTIVAYSGTEWEVGIGTYTASGTTLSRDTVLSSSNSGSLVNFSVGTKDVFVDYPAGRAVYENAAGNVDGYPITGGTINNTTIGATTPNTGVFTTLVGNSTSEFGKGSANYFRFTGNTTGNGPTLRFTGSDSNIDGIYAVRGTGAHRFFTNDNNQQQFQVSHTASAVNYVQVTGAATGSFPIISPQGSDTNISLQIYSKGTGAINFWSNNGGSRQFQVAHTAGTIVNYTTATGAAAGASPVFSVAGTDTNISQVFQSKGTGAIDLAAGSRGVNISNGGTVTAITRTAAGSGYTSIPSVAITAPTTAGGVQATATVAVFVNAGTVSSGGTGYTNGDVLTIVGGTFVATAATLTVTAVTVGVITAVSVSLASTYTATPTNPVSVTGGTGSGATFNLTYGTLNTFSITNAGSGYVEQPTVTFSGGGGSGAAAYASIGNTATIKGLYGGGSQIPLQFAGPAGNILQLMESGTTASPTALVIKTGASSAQMYPSLTNSSLSLSASGTSSIDFYTGVLTALQLRTAHTASAVNYVQVTGAATGSRPQITAQGSDANIGLSLYSKGNRSVSLYTNNALALDALTPSSGVNYFTVNGSVTGQVPSLVASGTDTNISFLAQSKGTGAIDLAAGSSGVNISNGGTVTAITRTAGGGSYTSSPTVVISAPTTAGGVQATATSTISTTGTPTIVSGGTGYTVNDVLTIVGGTPVSVAATMTVTAVSGGVITAASYTNFAQYTVAPTGTISVTGGTGSSATFNISFAVTTAFTITNAGSGYVEQPTVTFSGGGGSGAAAYATVGSGTIVRSVGASLSFNTPAGEGFRVDNTGFGTLTDFVYARGGASVSGAYIGVNGSSTNASIYQSSKGSGSLQFFTNNWSQEQLRVTHTASAVNYVQVTGAATGVPPVISAQGSDTNVHLTLLSKGSNGIRLSTAGASTIQAFVSHTASAVNFLQLTGAAAGASPTFSVAGTDTNIDLALTPKGTGNVRFGTRTASADAPVTGYLEIKDSGGTIRRLAIIG